VVVILVGFNVVDISGYVQNVFELQI